MAVRTSPLIYVIFEYIEIFNILGICRQCIPLLAALIDKWINAVFDCFYLRLGDQWATACIVGLIVQGKQYIHKYNDMNIPLKFSTEIQVSDDIIWNNLLGPSDAYMVR